VKKQKIFKYFKILSTFSPCADLTESTVKFEELQVNQQCEKLGKFADI
jgi:hypothetical protein